MEAKSELIIRFATKDDLIKCLEFDHCKKINIILNKIEMDEVIIVENSEEMIGYLRLEYIWSEIPYISLIWIKKDFRHRGIGTKLLGFLECYLLDQGYKILISSSQVDELEPQAWHRSKGFSECGILAGINKGDIGEIFFKKVL